LAKAYGTGIKVIQDHFHLSGANDLSSGNHYLLSTSRVLKGSEPYFLDFISKHFFHALCGIFLPQNFVIILQWGTSTSTDSGLRTPDSSECPESSDARPRASARLSAW